MKPQIAKSRELTMRQILLIVFVSLLGLSPLRAAEPTYALLQQFPYVTHLLADPSRARIYGTLTSSNSILVIDTSTLKAQTIPIGPAPVGLALSRDNARLYVANSGSTSAAIGVLDLNTLQVLSPIAAPVNPWDIAISSDGICYLSALEGFDGFLMRVDLQTGVSSNFGRVLGKALLRMHPVQEILYVADGSLLKSYDVTTTPPTEGQGASLGDTPINLAVSHDGTFLSAPTGGGNDYPPPYTTRIIPTSNLGSALGHLNIGPYPNAIAFSNDGKLAYHGASGDAAASQGAGVIIQVWGLSTFTRTTIVHSQLPAHVSTVTDLVVDKDGKYLFAAIQDISYPKPNPSLCAYSLAPPSQQSYPLNLSTRGRVDTGDEVLIAGFILRGGGIKRIALRALGPSLRDSGIVDPVTDPTLELRNSDGDTINFNDNWMSDSRAPELGAAGLAPRVYTEAGFVVTLLGGSYTAIVSKKDTSRAGVALVELYDLDPQPDSDRFANVSTRGKAGASDEVMIAGFITGGNGNSGTTVAVRAIGPSLLKSGVVGALADPTLEVHDGNGALLAQDDDWRMYQEQLLIDSGLAPTNDRESAVILSLQPGSYTAIVRGKDNSTGVGLVEVYNLDSK